MGYPVYCTGEVNQYGKKVFASVTHPGTKRKAEFEKSILDLLRPLFPGKAQAQAEKQAFTGQCCSPESSKEPSYGW